MDVCEYLKESEQNKLYNKQAELRHSRQLHDVLFERDLYQDVSGHTHHGGAYDRLGHRLEYPPPPPAPSSLVSVTVKDISVSDHYVVSCHLRTRPWHSARKSPMARNMRSVPPADIAADMWSQLPSVNEHSDMKDLIAHYNTVVSEILENMPPI